LRELRLRALRDAPYAFATSFERAQEKPLQHWEDFAVKSEMGETQVTLVVIDDAHWRAMASCFLEEQEEHTAWLVQMWVEPESRGLGLGRRLVEAAADWASARGVTRLKTSVSEGNAAAEALYEAAGFHPTGERSRLASNPSVAEVGLIRHLVTEGQRSR
jgi:GNAT superfamily N-acetyltransferase